MAAMGRYILFSGCGVEHDRTAVRSSILALADIMRMDLVEAPLTLCCGARADRGCGRFLHEVFHASAASVSINTLLPERAVRISVAVSGKSLAK